MSSHHLPLFLTDTNCPSSSSSVPKHESLIPFSLPKLLVPPTYINLCLPSSQCNTFPIQQPGLCFLTSHPSQLLVFQKPQQPFRVFTCPEVIMRATASASHAALYPSFSHPPLFSRSWESSPRKRKAVLCPELWVSLINQFYGAHKKILFLY